MEGRLYLIPRAYCKPDLYSHCVRAKVGGFGDVVSWATEVVVVEVMVVDGNHGGANPLENRRSKKTFLVVVLMPLMLF